MISLNSKSIKLIKNQKMRKLALGILAAAFKCELLTYDVKSTSTIRSLRNDMELDTTTVGNFDASQQADKFYTVNAKVGFFKDSIDLLLDNTMV